MAADYKYGVAVHIYIPIVKRAVLDFAVGADWTPVAGDVTISKNGGAAANVTNLPTAIVMGNSAMWDFSLTATEMQAAKVRIVVADAATKAVEDTFIALDTYGNASAQHAVDFTDSVRMGLTALPNAAAAASGGLLISGSNTGTTTFGALTVTGATTHTGNVVLSDGLTISAPSTLNRAGITVTGNGAGAGVLVTGGATGNGMSITASTGNGLNITTTSSVGENHSAIYVSGVDTGFTVLGENGWGMRIAGATVGNGYEGLRITSDQMDGMAVYGSDYGGSSNCGARFGMVNGDGAGIVATGSGAGYGIHATGGTGMVVSGSDGAGLVVTGTAIGVSVTGGTGSAGLAVYGGTGASAIAATGNGAGHGMLLTAGSTGNGLKIASTTGDAILTTVGTSGHGATFAGTGTTKHGINATGGATSSAGISATGGGTGAGISTDKIAVSGTATFTGAFTATNASNDIRGVTVSSIGTGVITSAALATDAIGADELAAAAVTKIAAGIWGAALPGSYTAGVAGYMLATAAGTTPADIWSYATRTLTSGANIVLTDDALSNIQYWTCTITPVPEPAYRTPTSRISGR